MTDPAGIDNLVSHGFYNCGSFCRNQSSSCTWPRKSRQVQQKSTPRICKSITNATVPAEINNLASQGDKNHNSPYRNQQSSSAERASQGNFCATVPSQTCGVALKGNFSKLFHVEASEAAVKGNLCMPLPCRIMKRLISLRPA